RFGRGLADLFSLSPPTRPVVRDLPPDDVLALVQRLLERLRSRHPQAPREIAPRALDLLVGYGWPGNVREMHNVLERALVLAGGGERIEAEHLSPALHSTGGARRPERFEQVIVPLEEVERQHIERALYLTSGNRSAAAERLGISRATLHNKIKIYGLQTVGRQ
ncbi:MAG: helix-turn-helix domain-containing protein, partial [Longimicrobiaceae bacterium]